MVLRTTQHLLRNANVIYNYFKYERKRKSFHTFIRTNVTQVCSVASCHHQLDNGKQLIADGWQAPHKRARWHSRRVAILLETFDLQRTRPQPATSTPPHTRSTTPVYNAVVAKADKDLALSTRRLGEVGATSVQASREQAFKLSGKHSCWEQARCSETVILQLFLRFFQQIFSWFLQQYFLTNCTPCCDWPTQFASLAVIGPPDSLPAMIGPSQLPLTLHQRSSTCGPRSSFSWAAKCSEIT